MSQVTKQYNPVTPIAGISRTGGTAPTVADSAAATALKGANVNFANFANTADGRALMQNIVQALAQYSGVQIPKIWSKQMNVKFYASTLLSKVANTNWQGEIKKGTDTVYIRTAPDITIEEYVMGQPMVPQMPVATMQELVINKAFYFLLKLHDIHDVQADQDLMAQWAADAAKRMAIKVEERCFADWYTPGAGTGKGGGDISTLIPTANKGVAAGIKSGSLNVGSDTNPITPGSGATLTGDVGDPLVTATINASTILEEQNIPEGGRFLLCSPLDINYLMRSRMWQAEKTGDGTTMVRNRAVGRIAGFDVYVSNLLPHADAGKKWARGLQSRADITGTIANAKKRHLMVAGTKDGCTYASQITDTESFRDTEDFGEKMRGLNVFGCELIKGECLVPIIVEDIATVA